MSRPRRQGHGLWRGLAWFWFLVLLGAGCAAGVLAWMGAPVETSPRVLIPPHAIQQPPAATPAPPPARPETPPAAPVAPPVEQPAAQAAPPPASAFVLPDAPEPPPLPEAESTADAHPITPPDPALLEQSAFGPLPRIAPDGREPRQVYARVFDRADARPRLGLVLRNAPESALRRLPGAIALAYREAPAPVLATARSRGMETLVLLPAAPDTEALDKALARFGGYIGALSSTPDRLADAAQSDLRRRGLLYLDAAPGSSAPLRAWGRTADIMLEDALTRGEIDRQLAALEALARDNGSALGILPDPPSALWLDRISGWSSSLTERGLILAPISALIRRPGGP